MTAFMPSASLLCAAASATPSAELLSGPGRSHMFKVDRLSHPAGMLSSLMLSWDLCGCRML